MALIPLTQTDRLRRAFLSMVKAVAPQLLYLGTYEANVVASSAPATTQSQLGGVTWVVSCAFTDAALVKILPPLANITVWPGPVWGYSVPAVGSLVRVGFVNGDPSKPAIVGLDPSTPPTSVVVGPLAAAHPVGRIGDAVTVTFTAADAALISAPSGPSGGPCSAPGGAFTLTGTITAGSPIVKSA